ncbi:MAG: uracil phosphoribosyltransferase [Rhodospirillales bacterium]|jgi:uracil phosphoribosyltransferase|nr:uracil phosphoribosyltransferase [Rhodospirillales bacterium]
MREHPEFDGLFVVDHPLVQHKLSLMRDKDRSTNGFRSLLREIALLMGYEITRDLPTELVDIETPVAPARVLKLAGKKLAVVPILRAGLEMADGLIELVPSARIGHIGLFRDPLTKRPVEYFVKLPEPGGRLFIVVDPMLATGHSLAHATQILKNHGVEPRAIRVMALVAAPEGVRAFHAVHPEIPVYVASLDSHLNDHAYIVPGLGDAGDRLFGTKERE